MLINEQGNKNVHQSNYLSTITLLIMENELLTSLDEEIKLVAELLLQVRCKILLIKAEMLWK